MKLEFTVTGMTCAACSARVEKTAGKVAGVEKAEVNLLSGKMVIEATGNAVADVVIENVQNQANAQAVIMLARLQGAIIGYCYKKNIPYNKIIRDIFI